MNYWYWEVVIYLDLGYLIWPLLHWKTGAFSCLLRLLDASPLVFTDDSKDQQSDERMYRPSYPPIGELIIRDEGVEKLLADINPSKASGPDEIPCRLLKELAHELAPVFASLFRQSVRTGELPSSWQNAWITPVFKKGSRCEAENYRPVSLTCVMCKILEHIICSHLRAHFDRHVTRHLNRVQPRFPQ